MQSIPLLGTTYSHTLAFAGQSIRNESKSPRHRFGPVSVVTSFFRHPWCDDLGPTILVPTFCKYCLSSPTLASQIRLPHRSLTAEQKLHSISFCFISRTLKEGVYFKKNSNFPLVWQASILQDTRHEISAALTLITWFIYIYLCSVLSSVPFLWNYAF